MYSISARLFHHETLEKLKIIVDFSIKYEIQRRATPVVLGATPAKWGSIAGQCLFNQLMLGITIILVNLIDPETQHAKKDKLGRFLQRFLQRRRTLSLMLIMVKSTSPGSFTNTNWKSNEDTSSQKGR